MRRREISEKLRLERPKPGRAQEEGNEVPDRRTKLARTKALLEAAIRVWEVKQGLTQ
jgi:hypothetical protein